jgi:hypothetical protein
MKVQIEREVELLTGKGVFTIRANGEVFMCLSFIENKPEDNIYNEARNLKEAMEWAARLEPINSLDELKTKSTIYESKK